MVCAGAPRLDENDLEQLDCSEWASRFKVTAKLGQGGFADVLCVKDGARQRVAALKVLKQQTSSIPGISELCAAGGLALPAGTGTGQGEALTPEVALFREARALKHARHPNVVQLHSVVHLPRACVADSSVSRGKREKMGSCWGLLLELLQGGSLQQQVYKVMSQPHSSSYSYLDALTWATDIATAVAHLHSLDPVIIHRDLKLQNFILKPVSGTQEAGGRKLPVAKLTDFGLHVMIDRPPSPFYLTTGEDGMPMLIMLPKEQQPADKEQQQQEQGTREVPSSDPQQQQQQALAEAVSTAAAGDCSVDAWTASNSSTPDADAVADAEARVAPVGMRSNSSGTDKVLVSALQHHSKDSKPKQRVAFAVDAAAGADAAPAPAAGPVAAQPQQQQLPPQHLQRLSPSGMPVQQWTRLTAGTLRRLSIDSMSCQSLSAASQANGSDRQPSGSSNPRRVSFDTRLPRPVGIPLLIQPPCAGQSSSSFVNASVPADAFGEYAAHLGGAGAGADAAVTGGMVVGTPPVPSYLSHAPPVVTHARHPSDGGSSQGAAPGSPESVSSILAAANSQRDYEVKMKTATLTAQRLQSHRSGTGSSNARSCASETTLTAASAAAAPADGADGPNTPRGASSVSGVSVRSGDWPTAASMMWDDLMEGETDQELLLDSAVPAVGSGHGGLIELPLSYNLTGHTGSLMYMAPEVYKRKPYNESVDVFSMGVMFYELFSRTLLIYTHTAANSPADCEKYAAQIAQGFRPKHVKLIPQEVWELIEACWEQDPMDRPSASTVLAKLQRLLQQAQEAASAKAAGGSRLGKLLNRPAAASPAPASPPAGGATAESAGGKAAASGDSPGAASEGQATAGRHRAEPACGCVIC